MARAGRAERLTSGSVRGRGATLPACSANYGPLRGAERRVISMMRLKSLSPVEVTAVSRIPGTQGIQEDTEGHDELGA